MYIYITGYVQWGSAELPVSNLLKKWLNLFHSKHWPLLATQFCQFVGALPAKALVFWSEPYHEPFFTSLQEPKCSTHVSDWYKQVEVRRHLVWWVGGWGRTSQRSGAMVSMAGFDICTGALSCWEITLLYLVLWSYHTEQCLLSKPIWSSNRC